MHTIAFVKTILFRVTESRDERGAAFTEYVVLVGVVVAFIVLIGFTGIGDALEARIADIAGQINPA